MTTKKNPPKWINVYPQGTKEGNEEQKMFISLARHPKYEWRSISALSAESGLSKKRVEEILSKYYNKGMIFQNPKNEEQWGYWERVPQMLKDDNDSIVQKEQNNRIDGIVKDPAIWTTHGPLPIKKNCPSCSPSCPSCSPSKVDYADSQDSLAADKVDECKLFEDAMIVHRLNKNNDRHISLIKKMSDFEWYSEKAGNDLLDAILFGTFTFGGVLETTMTPRFYQDKDLILI